MALVVKDRVRETTTTTGTGTVTLAGPVTGFQSFSVIGNANTTYYAIVDAATGDWEVGIGTYTLSGTTLSRDTVLESSNSGALVPFIAGTKDVFCTYPAERSVYADGTTIASPAANLTANGIPYASSTSALTTGSSLTFDGTNFTTTGNATATAFIPSSSTVPTNGLYLPASNTIGFSTNTTERMRITSDGRIQINGAAGTATTLVTTTGAFPLNNAATGYNFRADCTMGTANTAAIGFGSTYALPATGTFGSSYQFYADPLTTGGATLTNNFGFYCAAQTVGTNIYGFYSNIASGTGRWNFYANGTAANYFAGETQLANNLAFQGTGNRITGDFSNATVANRVAFQTSTVDGATAIIALPNGTSTDSSFQSFGTSSTTNSSRTTLATNSTESTIRADRIGSGTYLPMTFYTNGSERIRIDTSGRLLIGSPNTYTWNSITSGVQVNSVSDDAASMSLSCWSSTATDEAGLHFAKPNGNAIGSYAALAANDNIGIITFSGGASASTALVGAYIFAEADAAYTATAAPTRLIFATGSSTGAATERMRIDSAGRVGIGCIPSTYTLDVQNPDTTSGADTYVRIKSNSVSGDGDAQIYIDASDTGEAGIAFLADGVVTSYLQVLNGDDYVQLSNEVTSADLYLMSGVTAINDGYALRYARDGGEAVISGVTGTITSSALITTITGLSTTAGLYKGMFLTKTAGTGAFGVNATIKYIDVGANTITVESAAAMTAGSITFTATPNPTTIHIYSLSGGTWTTDADFARLAFGNADTSGAGDGGIKASINAYSYDTAGTGAGLDFYVSSNGTTLTKALRMTETGTLTSQPTYDNTAAGSTVVVTSAGLVRRTSSSLKYKKDVETLDYSLVSNAVENLRPVWYRTKTAAGDDKETWSHIGLIAEEVHTVEPRLVRYRTVEVTTDEFGKRVETPLEVPEPEDVDYGRLAVLLLAEVKAMKNEISTLKAEIAALKGV